MTRPSYVPSDIAASEVDFEIDEDLADEIQQPREAGHEFFAMNPYAAALVTAACGEWIVHRLAKLTTADDVAFMSAAIELTWAAAIDPTHAKSPPKREWLDDISEDVSAAMAHLNMLLQNAVQLCAQGDTLIGLTAYGAALLAERVCGTERIRPWLSKVVASLNARYPARRDEQGVIVVERPASPIERAAVA